MIAAPAALLLCLFLSSRFIAFLRGRVFGQEIREELIQHHGKKGTPTMGGIFVLETLSVIIQVFSSSASGRVEPPHHVALLGGRGADLAQRALGRKVTLEDKLDRDARGPRLGAALRSSRPVTAMPASSITSATPGSRSRSR